MKSILLIAAIFAFANIVFGQSYLYNTHQFGLHSTLLGGATTSGNDDLSMAYYNPAALHLAKPTANLSLIVPRLNNYDFDNFFGKNEAERSSFNVGFSPSLASFKFSLSKKINLIIITLKQNEWNNSTKVQNVFDLAEGRQEQIFKYTHKGNDRWIGTGGSFIINKNMAIGLSQFVSTASYTYNYTLSHSTFGVTSAQPTTHFEDRVLSSYANKFSFVTKVGFHFQFPNHNIGLVVKTPNYLRMLKRGSYERELSRIDQGQVSLESVIDFSLAPNIRTPWEFNLGYALSFKDGSKIWLNGAYYPAIPTYDMVTVRTVDGRSLIWKNGSKQVGNFSVGYSKTLLPGFEIICSYRSNSLAYENRPEEAGVARVFVLDDNRSHVSFGSKFNLFDNPVLLGIDWSFARFKNESLFSGFPNIEELNTSPSDYTFNSFTLLFTYGFLFRKRKTE